MTASGGPAATAPAPARAPARSTPTTAARSTPTAARRLPRRELLSRGTAASHALALPLAVVVLRIVEDVIVVIGRVRIGVVIGVVIFLVILVVVLVVVIVVVRVRRVRVGFVVVVGFLADVRAALEGLG